MSINFATMGMFNTGSNLLNKGGPYHSQNIYKTDRPTVLIKNIEMKIKNNLKEIKVRYINLDQ